MRFFTGKTESLNAGNASECRRSSEVQAGASFSCFRKRTGTAVLVLCSAAVLLLCLCCGEVFLSPARLFEILSGNGDPVLYGMLVNLRLPRIAAGFLAGCALGISGSVFQTVLKNPLADPFTAGVSGGASLGAAAGIILGLSGPGLALAAFGGSMVSVLCTELLSSDCSFGSASLILAGLAMSFVMSSGVMLLFAISDPEKIHRAMLWLMGDLSIARYSLLPQSLIICLTAFFIIMIHHRHCDLLSFGRNFSLSSGVSDGSIRILFLCASVLAAVSVSLAGVIAFVGLAVPHFVRFASGPGHLRLIPLSGLAGGVFLAACDSAGRMAASPYEIPAGIITGFLGGIFFIIFILRRRAGKADG